MMPLVKLWMDGGCARFGVCANKCIILNFKFVEIRGKGKCNKCHLAQGKGHVRGFKCLVGCTCWLGIFEFKLREYSKRCLVRKIEI